jgi:hypothetical protein
VRLLLQLLFDRLQPFIDVHSFDRLVEHFSKHGQYGALALGERPDAVQWFEAPEHHFPPAQHQNQRALFLETRDERLGWQCCDRVD